MAEVFNYCTPLGALFGQLGASAALGLANIGAAYGTVKAGVAVAHLGIVAKNRATRGMVPVIMAGILCIYGLIIAVIISNNVKLTDRTYTLGKGFLHLGAGLAGGFASLAAGFAIGQVGDACAAAYQKTETIFVAMILMLIFAEALGLYGLIVALLMNGKATAINTVCNTYVY
ncbi:V-type proton ATPase 16 kDa proteolipid subunit [Diplonema papillatum]|nr:V-type proton ATPase 16 kDa proteolipid subunit [Diplonema papillatum]